MGADKSLDSMRVEDVIQVASKLPFCKIDREAFLTKELKGNVDSAVLMSALKEGTVNAGISIDILNRIADGAIAAETTRCTAISFAAGVPGGIAMLGTVPADLVQYYVHVFRIAQKLAYVYGHKEIDLTDASQNELMIFLGVMFGVNAATAALAKMAASNATKIGSRVAAQPLSKLAIYNIAKKVLKWVGVKLTKEGVGKAVSKAVPVVGGVVSGGLTYATFKPMAKRLKGELAKYASMSPENLGQAAREADEILTTFEEFSGETPLDEVFVDASDLVSH